MIVRIWRTGLDESRADEYERFARERSLPMFQKQPGCVGVFFTRTEQGRAVITLWENERRRISWRATPATGRPSRRSQRRGSFAVPRSLKRWRLAKDGSMSVPRASCSMLRGDRRQAISSRWSAADRFGQRSREAHVRARQALTAAARRPRRVCASFAPHLVGRLAALIGSHRGSSEARVFGGWRAGAARRARMLRRRPRASVARGA